LVIDRIFSGLKLIELTKAEKNGGCFFDLAGDHRKTLYSCQAQFYFLFTLIQATQQLSAEVLSC
jgi:hypothetical protein